MGRRWWHHRWWRWRLWRRRRRQCNGRSRNRRGHGRRGVGALLHRRLHLLWCHLSLRQRCWSKWPPLVFPWLRERWRRRMAGGGRAVGTYGVHITAESPPGRRPAARRPQLAALPDGAHAGARWNGRDVCSDTLQSPTTLTRSSVTQTHSVSSYQRDPVLVGIGRVRLCVVRQTLAQRLARLARTAQCSHRNAMFRNRFSDERVRAE